MTDLDGQGVTVHEQFEGSAGSLDGPAVIVARNRAGGELVLRRVERHMGMGMRMGMGPAATATEVWAASWPGASLSDVQIHFIGAPPLAGIPPPGPPAGSEERVVLITQEGTRAAPKMVVRIFGPGGSLITTWSRAGRFVRAHYDHVTEQKAIIYERPRAAQHAAVLDLETGQAPLDVKIGRAGTNAVDVQQVGTVLLVVETKVGRGRTWMWSWTLTFTKVTIIDPSGRIQAVVWLPGGFVWATNSGRGIKAIVTDDSGQIHQYLVEEETTSNPRNPLRHTAPSNPLRGTFEHHQHDIVGGEDRWVLAVYDRATDKTTVRVFDRTSQVISTTVLDGRPAPAVPFVSKFGDYKAFAIQRATESEVTIVSLRDGQVAGAKRLSGRLDWLSAVSPAGGGTGSDLELENEDGDTARLPLPR